MRAWLMARMELFMSTLQYDSPEASIRIIERRRRLKPIVAAIVVVASAAVALLVAHFWSRSLPYPYGI